VTAERHVGSFPPPERILVTNSTDVNVDEIAFRRFCDVWAESFGISLSIGDHQGDNDAVIFNPGSGNALLAPDGGLPAVGVRFGIGRPATSSDALEWISGRGLDGYRWAIRYLRAAGGWPFDVYRYGDDPENLAELRVPQTAGPHPVVVLIHGGGWKALWGKDLMVPMAVDLARRGFASWNIEFRRLGNGGGWPGTFDDVSTAVDLLTDVAEEREIDLDRVALLGHSSGAHLALWAAARDSAAVRPNLVVSLSGMVDLIEADRRGLIGGENVTARLLGGRADEVPERYAAASPLELLPLGMRQVLIQGLADYIPDLVDTNRSYVRAAESAGDSVELIELAGVDHLQPIEPGSSAWLETAKRIEEEL
jgi:acetyl esterase/lipase